MNKNKCQNCGSNLYFNPNSGMLECMHCDTKFPVKEKDVANIKREYTLDYKPTLVQKKATTYKCASCGAQHMLSDNNTLTRCPSCGNTTIDVSSDVVYQPDGIVPFKVSRTKAGEIFKNWIKTRKFAPSDLIQMAKFEKISGFYTPVWNFNFISSCRYNATVTNIKVDDDGNEDKFTSNINNSIRSEFRDVLFSANENVENVFLDEIGPFPLDNMKAYSPEYMYGFSGTEANISVHDVFANIKEEQEYKNKKRVEEILQKKYDRIDMLNTRTELRGATFNYLYVPIWANHYKYKNKLYHCFINGATGEVTGKSPKSFWKIFSLVAGIVGGLALLVLLLI